MGLQGRKGQGEKGSPQFSKPFTCLHFQQFCEVHFIIQNETVSSRLSNLET